VVPIVYAAYRNEFFTTPNQSVVITQKESETIDWVLAIYGKKAPFLLVELTHQKNVEIKKENSIDYYTDFLSRTDRIVKQFDNKDFREVMESLAKT